MKQTNRPLRFYLLLALLTTLGLSWTSAQAQRETANAASETTADAKDASAKDKADEKPGAKSDVVTDKKSDKKTDKKKADEHTLRFHLMDGTVIAGKLKSTSLQIKTEFGALTVPISKIQSFAPGLDSHPQVDKKIQSLVEQLDANSAAKRDAAKAKLISYGKGLIPELRDYADDAGPKHKDRITKIVDALFSKQESFIGDTGPQRSLLRLDSIVTENFTIAGSIRKSQFTVQSKFGTLAVKLQDIKAVERKTADAPEQRRTITLTGRAVTGMRDKATSIKLNRGDRVIVSATGRITLTPWGSSSVSGPDGYARRGYYKTGIPYGCITGKIGKSGKVFKIGSKANFVADRPGTLYLGFAMRSSYANRSFPGSYKVKIRVIPAD